MLKATIKIALLLIWIALCLPPLWLAYKLRKTYLRERIFSIGSAGILCIIGVRVKTVGEFSEARPLLLVSNHVSYLDVWALASKTPARFTPKDDMAGWPVIALLCRLNGCVFVNRKQNAVKDARENIKEALREDAVVSLFPEATTGNGLHMLPFKSSFFSIAEEKPAGKELVIQPAAISYTHIGQLPLDSTQWPDIAWYGDMTLVPHFLKLLTLRKIDVTITFLPPVTLREFADRKKLAAYCHSEIEETLQRTRRA